MEHSIDHPHAGTCWETLGLRDGDTVSVLVVETDLDQDQDSEAFKSLQDAARVYTKTQKSINVVVF